MNCFGAAKSGRLQIYLVMALLLLLAGFIGDGGRHPVRLVGKPVPLGGGPARLRLRGERGHPERYPLAMSRDRLLPVGMSQVTSKGVPVRSLIVTVGSILVILLTLDPVGIAKLASAFQLAVFALVCLAVVVMRESRIAEYDPGYRSPWYPWMHIAGMVLPFLVIWQMGWPAILFIAGFVAAGTLWYFYYARFKADRNGAIYHIFERLGRSRYQGLDRELRGIL